MSGSAEAATSSFGIIEALYIGKLCMSTEIVESAKKGDSAGQWAGFGTKEMSMITSSFARAVRTGTLAFALAAGLGSPAGAAPAPIRALLITGGCCHDYAQQKDILKQGIESRANVTVEQVHTDDTTTHPPLAILGNPEYAKGYDVVIHDECAADISDPAKIEGVLKPHR